MVLSPYFVWTKYNEITGNPRKRIELVKMTLKAPKSKMKIKGESTIEFKVNKDKRMTVHDSLQFSAGKYSVGVTDKFRGTILD